MKSQTRETWCLGNDLESRLADSIPKADAEAKGREFEDRIRELESKLSESVPRRELDAAKAQAEARIGELQARLSESKSEAEALKEKVAGLESRLAEAERELEAARNRIKELEAAVAKPSAEEKLSERSRVQFAIDMLRDLVRAWGLEPGKVLSSEALAEPHRSYASSEEREREEIRLLGLALKDSLKKELLASLNFPNPK